MSKIKFIVAIVVGVILLVLFVWFFIDPGNAIVDILVYGPYVLLVFLFLKILVAGSVSSKKHNRSHCMGIYDRWRAKHNL